MSKERRLGRGLEALLGRVAQPKENQPTEAPEAADPQPADHAEMNADHTEMNTDMKIPQPIKIFQNQASGEPDASAGVVADDTSPSVEGGESDDRSDTDIVMVNIALIEANPYQPRRDFDDAAMAELSESISAHGLLQPIVARRKDEVYQLIAGERRLRAAQKAGWEEVPVRVIETDDRGVAELAIVENLQRKDLNALEKAASFRRYLKEHRCTQEQLAHRLRIDRSTIANLMRLLELPEEVQKALAEGKITQGHARALLPLGEEREQIDFCRRIQRDGLSVRKTETMVAALIQTADAEPLSLLARDGRPSKSANTADHLASLEQEFRSGLGAKVKITQGRGGSGKLVIHFKNHDEFNRVKEHILGSTQPQAKAG